MTTPTQGTPGGCFVGTLAMFPLGFAALGSFGLYKWAMLPAAHRHIDDRFWFLIGVTVVGLLTTVGLLYLSYRILRSTDLRGYDSRDPKQTGLRW